MPLFAARRCLRFIAVAPVFSGAAETAGPLLYQALPHSLRVTSTPQVKAAGRLWAVQSLVALQRCPVTILWSIIYFSFSGIRIITAQPLVLRTEV